MVVVAKTTAQPLEQRLIAAERGRRAGALGWRLHLLLVAAAAGPARRARSPALSARWRRPSAARGDEPRLRCGVPEADADVGNVPDGRDRERMVAGLRSHVLRATFGAQQARRGAPSLLRRARAAGASAPTPAPLLSAEVQRCRPLNAAAAGACCASRSVLVRRRDHDAAKKGRAHGGCGTCSCGTWAV
jgi:hypothetical protein